MQYKKNSKITTNIISGKVTDITTENLRIAYRVRLPRKDFKETRDIWIDETEVINLYEITRPKVKKGEVRVIWVYAQSKESALVLTETFLGPAEGAKARLVKPKLGVFIFSKK